MCDIFICADSGVELCEFDRKLLQTMGQQRQNLDPNSTLGHPAQGDNSTDVGSPDDSVATLDPLKTDVIDGDSNSEKNNLGPVGSPAKSGGVGSSSDDSNWSPPEKRGRGGEELMMDKNNNNRTGKNKNLFKSALQKTGRAAHRKKKTLSR